MKLAHDHATEQPFTRDQLCVEVPPGRESGGRGPRPQNGYSGQTSCIDAPRAGQDSREDVAAAVLHAAEMAVRRRPGWGGGKVPRGRGACRSCWATAASCSATRLRWLLRAAVLAVITGLTRSST